MIEAYSLNVSVGANQPVPFNNVTVQKGCTVKQTSPTTFVFNKKGTYMVSLDAAGAISGTDAANLVMQLVKNAVLQPQAQAIANSASATDVEALGFVTLVQVDEDNNPCVCSKTPTTIQVLNAVAALYNKVNITITKIC